MGENLVSTAEYPKDFYKHAFLKKLQEVNAPLYNAAESFFSSTRRSLYGDANKPANLHYLEATAQFERKRELQFLSSMGIKGVRPDEIGKYLGAFNELIGKKNIFERNVQRIKQIANGKSQGVDISSNFAIHLREKINANGESIENWNIENITSWIKQALISMYTTNKDKDPAQKTFREIAESIESLSSDDPYIKEIFDLYFGQDFYEQLKTDSKDEQIKAMKNASVEKIKKGINWQSYGGGSKKGNLMEVLEAFVFDSLGQLGGKAYRTGGKQVKADNLFLIDVETGEVIDDILTPITEGEKSVRMRNIKKFEKLHEKLKSGTVIEITDKNYSLTSQSFAENKGFTAESGLKAANFERILEKMRISYKEINDLMFVLVNIGEQLLSGNDNFEDLEKVMAAYIGYFLFDDLQFSQIENGNITGTNFIHVLNLDGVYIPLSTFLYAVYNALNQVKKKREYQKYVNVDIKSSFVDFKNNDNSLTLSDWEEYYNQRLEQISISVHFFGDFTNYIKDNIKM